MIVDAAHGAHLELSDDFPAGAIASGADIVVTSIHKTLPAPTQTSLIHIADGVQGAERVRQMLTVFQSSSPSYPLMAGIDAMMELIENRGQALFSKYVSRLNDIYKYAEGFDNLTLLTRDKLTSEYSKDFDFGKLVVYDRSGKITGRTLYDTLLNNYKLQPEMAAGGYVVLMTSIADDEQGFNRLKKALSEIDASLNGEEDIDSDKKRSFLGKVIDRLTGRKIKKVLFGNGNSPYEYDFNRVVSLVEAESISNIKTAVFENSESIPVELSEGRISAGFIMLYPPGIPIVVPGEKLSGEMVDSILESRKLGLTINGLMDSGEIKVLWE